MPYLRVGDNYATRAGRRADKAVKALAKSKESKGWAPEPRIYFKGKLLKPDVGAPARRPDPTVRRYIELKPNTPTGRAAAARQVKKVRGSHRPKGKGDVLRSKEIHVRPPS